jgi:hypothetical protein
MGLAMFVNFGEALDCSSIILDRDGEIVSPHAEFCPGRH